MVKMSKNKINNGKDQFSSELIASDTSQNPILANNGQNNPTVIATPQSVILKQKSLKQTDSQPEKVNKEGGELIKVETKSLHKSQDKSIFLRIKARIAAILLGSAVMLPILAIGTATYYFGSQAVNKQTILSKRANNIGLAETELARQQKLLATLLIATGTTALLAGTVSALGTKRLLDEVSKISTEERTEATETEVYREFIHNLSLSVSQPDVLKAIVEEARTYLNCDRVVVYSLNQDKYGVIVAESVVLGYTQWLDMTIEDPCFEAKYLDKYRDGRVRAINDISKVEMTPCHQEQLEAMEVKANLVTPIVNEGNLFGLLVAHQCQTPREWQTGEIEFLRQLAKKAGLALENSQLLDNLVRLQTQAET
ncbi:MAG: hypothetical protein RLZZ499_2094, partial [Cyanobacteriota bacterium]